MKTKRSPVAPEATWVAKDTELERVAERKFWTWEVRKELGGREEGRAARSWES